MNPFAKELGYAGYLTTQIWVSSIFFIHLIVLKSPEVVENYKGQKFANVRVTKSKHIFDKLKIIILFTTD